MTLSETLDRTTRALRTAKSMYIAEKSPVAVERLFSAMLDLTLAVGVIANKVEELAPSTPEPPVYSIAVTYVVQPGDTLSEIAERAHLPDWSELRRVNRLSSQDIIQPGWVLIIPGPT